MILSDRDLWRELDAGRLIVDPLGPEAVQPCSIDLYLSQSFRVMDPHASQVIDMRALGDVQTRPVEVPNKEPFVLHPGEFALACTMETVGIPAHLCARVEGKSSLGRVGLMIHSTAGWIDAGFHGQITLEMVNVSRLPILLRPGRKIAQLAVMELTSAARHPYGSEQLGSHYQGQTGATAAAG